MRGQPGLQYLKQVVAGTFPPPPMARLMNIRLVEVERGRVVFEGTPEEYHYNPLGIVHGGLTATLLDSAMGCSVHSCLEVGDRYTTIEIKVNYLKAMTLETGVVRGIATIVHLGRTVALAEARAVGADETLYAHATSICLIKRAGERAGRMPLLATPLRGIRASQSKRTVPPIHRSKTMNPTLPLASAIRATRVAPVPVVKAGDSSTSSTSPNTTLWGGIVAGSISPGTV